MSSSLREEPVKDSQLSHWDARWKLVSVCIFVIAVLALQKITVLVVATILTLVLLILSKASVWVIIRRIGLLWLTLFPALLVLGFSGAGHWWLSITILLRTTAVGCLCLMMFFTTSPTTLCAAAHQLGMPATLVQVVALGWRYARHFLAELHRVRMALFCRGFRLQTSSHAVQTLGYMTATLLIRGADRSERISEAMLARGFQGRFHSLQEFRTTILDKALFASLLLCVIALFVWDRIP